MTVIKKKFLTVEDVMEMAHVTRRTVYNYIYSGKLHAIKVGKRFLITEEDLDAFFQGGRVEKNPPSNPTV